MDQATLLPPPSCLRPWQNLETSGGCLRNGPNQTSRSPFDAKPSLNKKVLEAQGKNQRNLENIHQFVLKPWRSLQLFYECARIVFFAIYMRFLIHVITIQHWRKNTLIEEGSDLYNLRFTAIKMSLIPALLGDRRSNTCDPFSVDIWAPLYGFHFPGPLNNAHGSAAGEVSAFAGARIDWKETPEAHVFKADVPGLENEEVKVEVEEGRVLQISGERSIEKEEKNDKWHRVERSGGKFLRRFRLPENAKIGEIKAAMEDGVLTVTVPKEEVKKPEVDISG